MHDATEPSHTFALPSGETVTVDAADRALVEAAGPWSRLKHPWTTYVHANIRRPDGSRTWIKLHRLLLDPPDGMDVDHIDRDGLNNVRANLRVATRSQNQANSPPQPGFSSRYKGVYWHKQRAKWCATGTLEGRSMHLGVFTVEEDAARAYDDFAAATWPGFCWLNRDHFDLTEVS